MSILGDDGKYTLIKAVAIIAVVKTGKGHILKIQESGDLTEEWWTALPEAMQTSVDQMIKARRVGLEG